MMNEAELRKKAEKIAEDKVGFQIHLAIYTAVNIFLIVLWYITSPTFMWFLFPLGGWGIGLAAHFVAVYRGEGYVMKATEKEFNRLKRTI